MSLICLLYKICSKVLVHTTYVHSAHNSMHLAAYTLYDCSMDAISCTINDYEFS